MWHIAALYGASHAHLNMKRYNKADLRNLIDLMLDLAISSDETKRGWS